MSEIKVNNIQGLGELGPVVSGITTMASSGAMCYQEVILLIVVVEVVVYLVVEHQHQVAEQI